MRQDSVLSKLLKLFFSLLSDRRRSLTLQVCGQLVDDCDLDAEAVSNLLISVLLGEGELHNFESLCCTDEPQRQALGPRMCRILLLNKVVVVELPRLPLSLEEGLRKVGHCDDALVVVAFLGGV